MNDPKKVEALCSYLYNMIMQITESAPLVKQQITHAVIEIMEKNDINPDVLDPYRVLDLKKEETDNASEKKAGKIIPFPIPDKS